MKIRSGIFQKASSTRFNRLKNFLRLNTFVRKDALHKLREGRLFASGIRFDVGHGNVPCAKKKFSHQKCPKFDSRCDDAKSSRPFRFGRSTSWSTHNRLCRHHLQETFFCRNRRENDRTLPDILLQKFLHFFSRSYKAYSDFLLPKFLRHFAIKRQISLGLRNATSRQEQNLFRRKSLRFF